MQVTPHVYSLRLPFTIRTGKDTVIGRSVNVFFVLGRTITLIDTGVAGCEGAIFEYIRSIGRDPAEIAQVVLTHSHPDHLGAAHAIRQETGCTIMAHGAERAWIEDVNLQCSDRPVPGFHALVGGPVPVGSVLEDGDVVDTGSDHLLDCIVFHTPGHSPGSVSLLLKSEGILFTGDAVPVPGDLPVYDDVLASVQSIRRLARLDGIRVLLPAWDEPGEGIMAYQRMREALGYLQNVHDTVRTVAAGMSSGDPRELCRRAAAALGLPPEAATPLLARTFASHLRIIDRQHLFVDESDGEPAGGSLRQERRPDRLPAP